jgi:hypothetical protein
METTTMTTSSLRCARCSGLFALNHVETASSKVDAGWMYIICHACAIEHYNARHFDGEEMREMKTSHDLGYYAINPDALREVMRYAQRLANKSRNAHDRRYLARQEVR